MNEDLYIKRTVYRELFNDICAEFSIYRLKNDVGEEFEEIERQLWNCRETAVRMEKTDKIVYDNLLEKARKYLESKNILVK